jgi:hypothetical protein
MLMGSLLIEYSGFGQRGPVERRRTSACSLLVKVQCSVMVVTHAIGLDRAERTGARTPRYTELINA